MKVDIQAALETGHGVIWVEGYCQSSDCPGREVRIKIKDHDGVFLQMFERSGLVCPICQGKLKLHWALTLEEKNTRDERDARGSVNVQMFLRDKQTMFFPLSIMLDERLPPTPEGWFDKR